MSERQMVHLHTHSEFSGFDGLGKQEAFIQRAVDLGQPAIAFTEHGSLRGVYKLDENVNNIGNIKPLYGIEFYVAHDHTRRGLDPEYLKEVLKGVSKEERSERKYQEEVKAGVRDRFHLTVLAKNNVGLKNLFRLSSLGWLKGYFKRPRIDMAMLYEYREGLVVLSGCSSGAINDRLLKGDMAGAVENAAMLHDWFGDDFYMEIMPHNPDYNKSMGSSTSTRDDAPDQVKCNKGCIAIAKSMGIEVVATQDAHWICEDDADAHEVYLAIMTNDVMANPDRFRFDVPEYWLRSRPEMETAFSSHHPYIASSTVQRALDNTLVIADKLEAKLELDRFKAMIPVVYIPPEFHGDDVKYMRHLCKVGWETRGIERRAAITAVKFGWDIAETHTKYIKRLTHELKAIELQKVSKYFLLVWDLYNWARSQGIMVGPGRGSAGGSLVSFLMGITDVDPLEHGLIFERFLAPGRIDLPDIDCDFEARRREDVIQYLRTRWGSDKVAQIATIGTLKGKATLRDISRVLQIPKAEVDEVVDSIIERSSGDERASSTLEDSFKEFDVCRKFNVAHPEVLQYAKKLEGNSRNLGIHAAGVVISPVPLIDVVPLEIRLNAYGQGEPKICTAVDMYGAAAFGLMKLDVLGLRNLDCIKDCLQAIKERHGVDVDLDFLDLNDKPTLDNFTAHKYVGIFQYDTASADKICEGVAFDNFEDVVAMIALDRPGTARSGLATEYIKRKQDPAARTPIHPVVDKICSDTLGVIVYQEHVLKIFTEVAGFSPATADSLRKKIAKKWGDEAIGKERENFIAGAVSRGFSQKLAEKLIDQITFFGSYGFNKSHATAYGLTSYRQMWLRTYYPVEFLWSLLKNEPVPDQVNRLVTECRKTDIVVRSPHVNYSGHNWRIDGNAIVGALSDLKMVGEGAATAVETAREAGGQFKHFIDFAKRIDRKKCNRRVVEMLLRAGSMTGLIPNEKWMLEPFDPENDKKGTNLAVVWDLTAKGKIKEAAGMLVASASQPEWDKDERQMIATAVNPLASGKHPMEPWHDFIHKQLKVRWTRLDDELLWELSSAFVAGRIVEVKYNQVGDFHTGALPSEEDRKRQKWGARYANVNIEDISGKNYRVKVDHDIFDQYRHIIDKGVGTVVAVHVSIAKKWKNMRAHFMISLLDLKLKMGKGEPLTPFERALTDDHPVKPQSQSDISALQRKAEGGFLRCTAMVTHVNNKLDKKGREMGFFGLLGFKGYIDGICFAGCWPHVKAKIIPGRLVRVRLKVEDAKDSAILFDDDGDATLLD